MVDPSGAVRFTTAVWRERTGDGAVDLLLVPPEGLEDAGLGVSVLAVLVLDGLLEEHLRDGAFEREAVVLLICLFVVF